MSGYRLTLLDLFSAWRGLKIDVVGGVPETVWKRGDVGGSSGLGQISWMHDRGLSGVGNGVTDLRCTVEYRGGAVRNLRAIRKGCVGEAAGEAVLWNEAAG